MTKPLQTKQEALDQICEYLNRAAILAHDWFDDADIFNYGRAYEYSAAKDLGHIICETTSGSDATSPTGNETYEYKSAQHKGYDKNGCLRSHTFNYFGFSRFASYEDQVKYCQQKILRDAAHFWTVRSDKGFANEVIFRIESKDVLTAFLKRLPAVWGKKNKDPRINIGLTLKDVGYKVTVIKAPKGKVLFRRKK